MPASTEWSAALATVPALPPPPEEKRQDTALDWDWKHYVIVTFRLQVAPADVTVQELSECDDDKRESSVRRRSFQSQRGAQRHRVCKR